MERCLSSIRSADASIKCSAYRAEERSRWGNTQARVAISVYYFLAVTCVGSDGSSIFLLEQVISILGIH